MYVCHDVSGVSLVLHDKSNIASDVAGFGKFFANLADESGKNAL